MTEGRPACCDGRRLRFEYDLGDDESVPGALIAALGPQWLDEPRPVLEAAGLTGRRPGSLFLMSDEEARRLAWVIRCDPDRLAARTGRVGTDTPAERHAVTFDGLVLPRSRFEARRRRVAPTSLADGGRHRIAWMDRLLPYCPVTLERLVDGCAACGSPLLWTSVGRIDACGRCGETVRPSSAAPLGAALAMDYRAFAGLSSPIREHRLPVVAELPSRLIDVPCGTLSRLAFHLGGILHDPPFETRSPKSWSSRPAVQIAQAAATGFRMLRHWPDTLRSEAVMTADSLRNDREGFERHRERLKRLIAFGEDREIVKLVREALPDLSRHRNHSFAGERRYYLGHEVVRRLGIHNRQFPLLRKWPGLHYVVVPSQVRTMGQYDADQIDDLAGMLRSASPIETAASRLGLPVYAAEQFAAAGLLEHEDHGAALALGRDRWIRPSSLERLLGGLAAVVSKDAAPTLAVPLRVAARRFGGAAKPWSTIIAAALAGDLALWPMGGGGDPLAVLVNVRQLEAVVASAAPRPSFGSLRPSTTM